MRIAAGVRTTVVLTVLVCAGVSLAAIAPTYAQSSFQKGSISVGAHGGYAIFVMSQLNDIIRATNSINGTDFNELDNGWDVAGDVRYAVTDRYFVGVEGGMLFGEVSDGEESFEASAIPVLLLGGGGVTSEDSNITFRIIGGLGAVVNGKLDQPNGQEISGTAFLFQLGGEIEYRPSDSFGATFQALVRQAKVSEPDGAPYDLDFSGGSARLGLRAYFGE